MSAKPKPIDRLMAAMSRYALARGDALWTQGYRAAKGEPNESQLYAKEMRQWDAAGRAESAFRKLALRLLRDAKP